MVQHRAIDNVVNRESENEDDHAITKVREKTIPEPRKNPFVRNRRRCWRLGRSRPRLVPGKNNAASKTFGLTIGLVHAALRALHDGPVSEARVERATSLPSMLLRQRSVSRVTISDEDEQNLLTFPLGFPGQPRAREDRGAQLHRHR